MIPQAYSSFIKQLISKTNDGELKWQKMSDKSIVLRKPESTIEIGFYSDDDAELSYYYFNFNNIKTKNEAGFRISNNEIDYKVMETLFALATASANDIESELKNFFGDI